MTRSAALGLEDGKEDWKEGDFDARDGLETEEAVFDLGDELGVGGLVGTGGVEGDAREVAGGEAGDGSSGCGGVGGEGGGLDEACVDDVAVVGVAVAEEVEEVGWVHGCRRARRCEVGASLTVSFLVDVDASGFYFPLDAFGCFPSTVAASTLLISSWEPSSGSSRMFHALTTTTRS